MQRESEFKEDIRDDLETLKNSWFFKTQERTVRGIPDWILCINGMFVALEAKADESSAVEELQVYNVNRITGRAKGLAFFVYPKNWKKVFKVLQTLDGDKHYDRNDV